MCHHSFGDERHAYNERCKDLHIVMKGLPRLEQNKTKFGVGQAGWGGSSDVDSEPDVLLCSWS